MQEGVKAKKKEKDVTEIWKKKGKRGAGKGLKRRRGESRERFEGLIVVGKGLGKG